MLNLYFEVVECAPPPIEAHTIPAPVNLKYVYTANYTYVCENGYQLDGDMTVTCGSEGTWSCLKSRCVGMLPI